jgi:hypothetical protein
MLDATSTVLVVDDDVDLRSSLGRLLRSVGMNAKLFASVSDFLKSELPDAQLYGTGREISGAKRTGIPTRARSGGQ